MNKTFGRSDTLKYSDMYNGLIDIASESKSDIKIIQDYIQEKYNMTLDKLDTLIEKNFPGRTL